MKPTSQQHSYTQERCGDEIYCQSPYHLSLFLSFARAAAESEAYPIQNLQLKKSAVADLAATLPLRFHESPLRYSKPSKRHFKSFILYVKKKIFFFAGTEKYRWFFYALVSPRDLFEKHPSLTNKYSIRTEYSEWAPGLGRTLVAYTYVHCSHTYV